MARKQTRVIADFAAEGTWANVATDQMAQFTKLACDTLSAKFVQRVAQDRKGVTERDLGFIEGAAYMLRLIEKQADRELRSRTQ